MAFKRSTPGGVSQSPSNLRAPAPDKPHQARLVAKEALGENLGIVTLEGEGLGAHVKPGQFSMLWRPSRLDFSTGTEVRPFAYFAAPDLNRAQFLVRERKDAQTTLLDAPLGTVVPILGPLGRPYPQLKGRVWAVAGGVGAAALGSLLPPPQGVELTLVVGLKQKAESGIENALRARLPSSATLEVIHEDGPKGGTVMTLLSSLISARGHTPDLLLGCGPEPMLRALASEAHRRAVALYVSVNTPLACGTGRCGQCVILDARGEKHLACVDGPIYPGELLFGASA